MNGGTPGKPIAPKSGVPFHPPNFGGGVSETPCFTMFSGDRPLVTNETSSLVSLSRGLIFALFLFNAGNTSDLLKHGSKVAFESFTRNAGNNIEFTLPPGAQLGPTISALLFPQRAPGLKKINLERQY